MADDNSLKGLHAVGRRITNLSKHLTTLPSCPPSPRLIVQSPASDSYRRIHGEVSAEPAVWMPALDELGKEFTDILYEKAVGEGIAKITINRPERRNAFRPHTIKELIRAFNDARDDCSIGVVILTGKGNEAFCSGGDQALRTSDGYTDFESFGRLNVLDLQVDNYYAPFYDTGCCESGNACVNSASWSSSGLSFFLGAYLVAFR